MGGSSRDGVDSNPGTCLPRQHVNVVWRQLYSFLQPVENPPPAALATHAARWYAGAWCCQMVVPRGKLRHQIITLPLMPQVGCAGRNYACLSPLRANVFRVCRWMGCSSAWWI